ncbi:16S rRNA (guanine(527)-N(7))-methyltransferase RsmG [Thermocrispum agreste]|uniref:16S rRNA (guanine(527)-N(7))-methyltransferase RsmG n=1 Tax=Thermocrispum agreste TaxID=37925 RepID=UPI001FE13BFB|nr:16S rRNA (guanine(527)-N(7))-methyltransferase RsmG [Thermocrispum agreste]
MFGESVERLNRFVALLAEQGVERGLIGPREIERIWDRHVLNSAVVGELVPEGAHVVDVGSGGGFPGVPLALARPDISITLLESMARRVQWLEEVLDELSLENADVLRGRAEDKAVRAELGAVDVVTARAVAPLGRLAQWCLPLLRTGGLLLAVKGASVAEEIARDEAIVEKAGGESIDVVQCGVDVLEVPATVVVIEAAPRSVRSRKGRRRRR